jgi:hypothetical protein
MLSTDSRTLTVFASGSELTKEKGRMALFKKSKRLGSGSNMLVQTVAMAYGARGMAMTEATARAVELVEEVTAESLAAGGGLPAGYGTEFLRRARAGDQPYADKYEARSDAGVSDDDILWYWNMSDVERRLIDRLADEAGMALFIHAIEELAEAHPDWDKGRLGAAAGERVRHVHPMFGDPDDESHESGDDRPLFPELKDRIDRFVDENFSGLEQAHAEILEFTTFNAWARTQIAAGRL